ncbi:MAG TPA: class I SAM-dependent methyltransferase [Acidimicrobiia bacterium]|nr:class I SAM-dependent methyltransferase [Acidimicrobiia bacterium]
MDPNQPGYRGFKDYTPRFLKIYDPWVAGFMAVRVWKSGLEPGLDLYRNHMGRRHLDIGPGTGYFIARSDPPRDVQLTLVDANPHVLEYCAETLAKWSPTLVEANVLETLPLSGSFDSAALAHVIHCLPGPMAAKAPAIEHTAATLTDDGVLFGGTVLGPREPHTWPARTFLEVANLQGGFDNRDDTVEGLRSILEGSFEEVEVDVAGSIAYFVATHPRRQPLS